MITMKARSFPILFGLHYNRNRFCSFLSTSVWILGGREPSSLCIIEVEGVINRCKGTVEETRNPVALNSLFDEWITMSDSKG